MNLVAGPGMPFGTLELRGDIVRFVASISEEDQGMISLNQQGFIERLLAMRTAWQRGETLNQNQLAAAVADAWSRPRAYRMTQPSDSKLARQTWARARAVYRRMQSAQEFDVTIDVPATEPRRSSRLHLQVVRRSA